jgi:hypothetical protein
MSRERRDTVIKMRTCIESVGLYINSEKGKVCQKSAIFFFRKIPQALKIRLATDCVYAAINQLKNKTFMKKSILALAVSALFLSAPAVHLYASEKTVAKSDGEFMKSEQGTWQGMDKMWYKLDKDAKLWASKDGKKWTADKDGMWQDKDARWLKIGEGMLWWSADGGKTWVEVPEWQWEGPDGTWYKFDQDWSLWVNK